MFWRLLCALDSLKWRSATVLLREAIDHIEGSATRATASAPKAIALGLWLNRIFEFFLGSCIYLGEALAAGVYCWFDGIYRAFFLGGEDTPAVALRLNDLRFTVLFNTLRHHLLGIAPRMLILNILSDRSATYIAGWVIA